MSLHMCAWRVRARVRVYLTGERGARCCSFPFDNKLKGEEPRVPALKIRYAPHPRASVIPILFHTFAVERTTRA
jgi:hypothetical protein